MQQKFEIPINIKVSLKSLERPMKKNGKSQKPEKQFEMVETVVVRDTTNNTLEFLRSRDQFWRNLGK